MWKYLKQKRISLSLWTQKNFITSMYNYSVNSLLLKKSIFLHVYLFCLGTCSYVLSIWVSSISASIKTFFRHKKFRNKHHKYRIVQVIYRVSNIIYNMDTGWLIKLELLWKFLINCWTAIEFQNVNWKSYLPLSIQLAPYGILRNVPYQMSYRISCTEI